MERIPCVYMLASAFHRTIYTGVTSQLIGRVWQHREEVTGGFTARWRQTTRVVEVHHSMESAISREKTLKHWRRAWKVTLIEESNPTWRDLAEDFGFDSLIRRKVDPGSSPG